MVAAVEQQLRAFSHTCYQVMPYEGYVALAEKLNALAPGEGPKKTVFFSTGAEATENAVKIARAYTKRTGVIAMSGAFHGRTMMAMAMTGKVAPYKSGFGPPVPDVYRIPFPSELHGVPWKETLRELEVLFKTDADPERVAALFIEPVQGEGGFYVAPPELLVALAKICKHHGILFVADEVQCGFGRTGKMFAIEHAGVSPDLVVMAKSLAGGFPLSAVSGRAEIMDAPAPGGLGGTYAGSPIAIAAALAVLEAFDEEDLLARGRAVGDAVRSSLEDLARSFPTIAEVRGLGPMLAVELCEPGAPHQPLVDLTKAVQRAALERGLLLLVCGVYGNVLRMLMPLTIERPVLDEGLGILRAAFEAAHAHR